MLTKLLLGECCWVGGMGGEQTANILRLQEEQRGSWMVGFKRLWCWCVFQSKWSDITGENRDEKRFLVICLRLEAPAGQRPPRWFSYSLTDNGVVI